MTEEARSKQEQFERVAEVFARARRVVPAQRDAFLDVECGDDTRLRAEVVTLLDAHADEPALPVTLAPGIAGFRIVRRIGVGGMGTVYEAEQEHPQRRVALKVLRLDALSDESLARFETEARALARLQHPGIARIFAAGRFEGPAGEMPYLAMELVDGPSIREYARRIERDDILRLLIEICAAVEHAHQRGILHRDLKPANILVPADGKPRVLDFGVAREIEEPSPHTRTGHLLGTLAYMSPEQARGEFDDLDTRCDIYALGVIAYELVSGRPPHDVSSLPLLEAARVVAERPHESLDKSDLSMVIDKALAKNRDHRYPSASALADDLTRVLNREPVQARPPSRIYHLGRFVQRNRTSVAIVAIALIALFVSWVQAIQSANYARAQQRKASRLRYASQIQAASLTADTDIETARTILEETEKHERGWVWDHIHASTFGDIESTSFPTPIRTAHASRWDRIRFVANGRAYGIDGPLGEGPARGEQGYYVTPDGGIIATERTGAFLTRPGEPARHIMATNGVATAIAFDKERNLAVVGTHGHTKHSPPREINTLSLWDTKTHRCLWSIPSDFWRVLAFTPDGKHIVGAKYFNGIVAVLDRDTGKELRSWKGHASHISHLEISATTGRIATWALDWHIRMWDMQGNKRSEFYDSGLWVHALEFSPDDARLAVAHMRGALRVHDAETLELIGTSSGASNESVMDVHWNADGSEAICLTDGEWVRRTVNDELACDVLTHHIQAPENDTPYTYDAAFSHDGRLLATIGWDDTARVLDVGTNRVLRTMRVGEYPEECEFGPNGLLYVACRYDGDGVSVWDPATGKMIARRPGGHAEALSVSPTGKEVAFAMGWIHYVDPVTLRSVRPKVSIDGGVWSCEFAPSGRLLAAGTGDGRVHILRDGKIVRELRSHKNKIKALAWSSDGTRLAVGCFDGKVREFDTKTWKIIHRYNIRSARVHALVYSPDGRILFAATDEHAIYALDTVFGSNLSRLRGHTQYVKGLVMSPDGNRMASASGDNTIRIWHRRTHKQRREERQQR